MNCINTKSLSRSLLKGTVVNLGLQLANRSLNKNNFWQTLLVGAAGGFGDYFGGNAAMGAIIGGGNALINKTKDFSTAIKYAAIGGAADLLLKVKEAKAEELPGKIRWQTIETFKLPNGDLPIYRQTKEYVGCTHATLISIAKYLGYNTTDLEKEERNLGESDGSDFYQLAKQKGFNVAYIDNDIREVGLKLQQNCPAAITYNPVSGGNPHTVAINKIEYQKNINNPKRTRYLIKTMNPLYSTWYTLSETEFMNGRIRIIKH